MANNYINPDQIKEEFIRIRSLGWLKNTRSQNNDGAAGNIFEDHLGVDENNLTQPDYKGWEVKTKKQMSKSWMSLYTKKPSDERFTDNYMREKFGIPDERYPDVKCFRTSLYAHRFSIVYQRHKIKMNVNRNENKLEILFCDLDENIIDKNVYWTFKDLLSGAKKLKNMFVVSAEVKNENGIHYFKYTNATILMNYEGNEKILDLLEKGLIRYDNRLGVHGPSTDKAGQPHNHGGGLRIDPKNIHLLYKEVLEV